MGSHNEGGATDRWPVRGNFVVMDETALDQINRGNAEYARALSNALWRDRVTVLVSKDVLSRRAEADRHLVADLGVGSTGLIDKEYQSAMERYNRDGRFLGHFNAAFRGTAALALYFQARGHKVELMTSNREFQNQWRTYGGTVVRDVAHVRELQGKPDYDRARRLMRPPNGKPWPPLNIGSNGIVLPTAPMPARRPQPKPDYSQVVFSPPPGRIHYESPTGKPPNATVDGKSVGWPRQIGKSPTDGTTARTGEPLKAPNENRIHNSHHSGSAKAQGIRLALQGLNRAAQYFIQIHQNEKLKAVWKRKEPFVRKHLEDNPELGALILAYKSRVQKTGPEHDSAMDHPEHFQEIGVAYGYSREHALDKYNATPQVRNAGRGANYPVEWAWIPPGLAVDLSKLPVPFAAAGLAKFVEGSEELVRVKFDVGWTGLRIDDKAWSVEKIPAGAWKARFLYLYVPANISFVYQGKRLAGVLEIDEARPRIVPQGYDAKMAIVPVVKLDSRMNPNDAVAAMVFPADDFTRSLFEGTKPTENAARFQISGSNMFSFVRWVKPHKMEVLRHFASEHPFEGSDTGRASQHTVKDRQAYDKPRHGTSWGTPVSGGGNVAR